MASLERWKSSCLVVFALIGTNLALKSLNADATLTKHVDPFFPISLNCPLIGKPELAAFKSSANEVCLSSITGSSLFCDTLLNLTRRLCELDVGRDGTVEIFADTFKNVSLPQQDLCALVVALPPDNRTPLVDAVRTVVVGTDPSLANVTCARQCNGTAQVLCNFMLLATRILKHTNENVILSPNIGGNISAITTTTSTKIVSTIGNATGVQPSKVDSRNRTSTTTTTKEVVVPAVQGTGLANPSDNVALGSAAVVPDPDSATAHSRHSIDLAVTKVTSSATVSDTNKPKSPVSVAIGTDSDKEVQSESTVVTGGRRKSSTTSRTPPATSADSAGAAPVPSDPFDDFPNTGDEIVKDSGQAAATVRYPPGADFEVDGPGDTGNNIPLQNEDDYGEEQPPLVDKVPSEINETPAKSVPQKHGTFSIAYPDGSGSGFLPVFFMFIILSISLYFVYHYRNKIMGLLLEGRSERRRRPNTNQYRRLSNKLEDVLPVDAESGTSKRVANVIY